MVHKKSQVENVTSIASAPAITLNKKPAEIENTSIITTNVGDGWKAFDNNSLSNWVSNTNVNTLTYTFDRVGILSKYSIYEGSIGATGKPERYVHC